MPIIHEVDVGATLAGLAVILARSEVANVPFAATVMLLGTFVWDATFTFLRRVVQGDFLRPHSDHMYQRLALAGWPQGRVRLVYLGLALVCLGLALAIRDSLPAHQALILAAAVCLAAALVWVTMLSERRIK